MDISQNMNQKENKDLSTHTANTNSFSNNNYQNPYNYTLPQIPTPYNINPFPILSNPFISYMNPFLNFSSQFINPQKETKDEEKQKNEINIKNKKKFKRKSMPEDDEDLKEVEIKEQKEKFIENKNKNTEESNDENNDSKEDNIYVYTENEKKYLYIFHKPSKDKKFYELRCKDRNCKGRAKINIDTDIITITQKCKIEDFENHNYIQEEIIRKKIGNKKATLDETKDPKFQKYYFIESYSQYPSLNYNEIL